MSCGSTDFIAFRGDTWQRTLTFTAGGVAFSVATWTFAGQLRTEPDSDDIAATFSFDTSDAANGIISVSADLTGLEGYYSYDMQFTGPGGITTFMAGRFLVKPDTTY